MDQLVQKYFLEEDYNCAESMLHILNDCYQLNLKASDYHLVSGFGGGCGCGKICGALAGCISALGALQVVQRAHITPDFKENCAAFVNKFDADLGGTDCASLKPHYFQEGIRCARLLEKGIASFTEFTQQTK